MAKSALYNIEKLYNAGDGVFFFYDYSQMYLRLNTKQLMEKESKY